MAANVICTKLLWGQLQDSNQSFNRLAKLPICLLAHQLSLLPKIAIMKGKYFVAAGLAIIAAGVYLWQKRKKAEPHQLPQKENERHHLTNVFSKAKSVAMGN